jgi:hypothetical protein
MIKSITGIKTVEEKKPFNREITALSKVIEF